VSDTLQCYRRSNFNDTLKSDDLHPFLSLQLHKHVINHLGRVMTFINAPFEVYGDFRLIRLDACFREASHIKRHDDASILDAGTKVSASGSTTGLNPRKRILMAVE